MSGRRLPYLLPVLLLATGNCFLPASAEITLWKGLRAGTDKAEVDGLGRCERDKEKEWCKTVASYEIGGYRVPATMMFENGRLSQVQFYFDDPVCKTGEEAECKQKFEGTVNELRETLSAKYGKARSRGGMPWWEWRQRGLVVTVMAFGTKWLMLKYRADRTWSNL